MLLGGFDLSVAQGYSRPCVSYCPKLTQEERRVLSAPPRGPPSGGLAVLASSAGWFWPLGSTACVRTSWRGRWGQGDVRTRWVWRGSLEAGGVRGGREDPPRGWLRVAPGQSAPQRFSLSPPWGGPQTPPPGHPVFSPAPSRRGRGDARTRVSELAVGLQI